MAQDRIDCPGDSGRAPERRAVRADSAPGGLTARLWPVERRAARPSGWLAARSLDSPPRRAMPAGRRHTAPVWLLYGRGGFGLVRSWHSSLPVSYAGRGSRLTSPEQTLARRRILSTADYLWGRPSFFVACRVRARCADDQQRSSAPRRVH